MEALNLSVGVVIGLVMVISVYWFVQLRRPESLPEVAAMFVQAEEAARILVWGAQQVYESDQTHGVDNRYAQVEATLLELFPKLEAKYAKQIIEGSVLAMKIARERGWLPPSSLRPSVGAGET